MEEWDSRPRTIQLRGDGVVWRLLVWQAPKRDVFEYLKDSNYVLHKDYRLTGLGGHTEIKTRNDVLAVSLRLRFEIYILNKQDGVEAFMRR